MRLLMEMDKKVILLGWVDKIKGYQDKGVLLVFVGGI